MLGDLMLPCKVLEDSFVFLQASKATMFVTFQLANDEANLLRIVAKTSVVVVVSIIHSRCTNQVLKYRMFEVVSTKSIHAYCIRKKMTWPIMYASDYFGIYICQPARMVFPCFCTKVCEKLHILDEQNTCSNCTYILRASYAANQLSTMNHVRLANQIPFCY
jgi:hypothetical protein